jgi:hypothetical protein
MHLKVTLTQQYTLNSRERKEKEKASNLRLSKWITNKSTNNGINQKKDKRRR